MKKTFEAQDNAHGTSDAVEVDHAQNAIQPSWMTCL